MKHTTIAIDIAKSLDLGLLAAQARIALFGLQHGTGLGLVDHEGPESLAGTGGVTL